MALEELRCPADGSLLRREGEILVSEAGRAYPVVEDVPVLLQEDVPDTLWVCSASREAAWAHVNGERDDQHFLDTVGFTPEERRDAEEMAARVDDGIAAIINYIVGATNGYLYQHLRGRLSDYPIPRFRLQGRGRRLLDVGCSWGRWTIAAARAGFRPVGIDPSLGVVLAAKRLCERLGVEADFVVGDARYLPFGPQSFEAVHSYSVLQHFARSEARRAFAELARVLQAGGESFVQMPNRLGVRCLYHQAWRGFSEGEAFDVRYWSLSELKELGEAIGPATLEVDGFFGLGIQPSDIDYLDAKGRAVVRLSESLRRLTDRFPPLMRVADSVYVRSRKPAAGSGGTGEGREPAAAGLSASLVA